MLIFLLFSKMKNLLLLFFSLITIFFQTITTAATVDTLTIYSKAMHVNSKSVIILPASYKNSDTHYPVVYLLHGYSGNYADWIKKVGEVVDYADEFQVIIVCPDGHYNSWYVDSPVDSTIRYDRYISTELPAFIDSAFRTLRERDFRAITGLSMGGHGALSLAWKHPDVFGACGSMSGLQDLVPWKTKYDLTKVLGDTLHNKNYYHYSVINLVKTVPAQIPAIIFDCGISDPFIKTNRQLHAELEALHIPHDYIERNGTHNWNYWSNSVGFQLLFFHKFFQKSIQDVRKK